MSPSWDVPFSGFSLCIGSDQALFDGQSVQRWVGINYAPFQVQAVLPHDSIDYALFQFVQPHIVIHYALFKFSLFSILLRTVCGTGG